MKPNPYFDLFNLFCKNIHGPNLLATEVINLVTLDSGKTEYVNTGPANIFGGLVKNQQKRQFTSKEQFFRGLQNLSSLHKIGCRSAETNYPIFLNMLLLA
jgi:hypothetical protein